MQLVGHTMATPGRTALESIELFAQLGLDATELVCRDGMALPPGTSLDEARRIAARARDLNCPVVTVTPYAWDINSADPAVAQESRDLFRRACDLAEAMGARFVRAYGGKEHTGSEALAAWERTIEALQELAPYAAARNLTILVENHPGTMTRTGTDTRRLLDAVDCPNVLALYDPANAMNDTDEAWETTLSVQLGKIGYVHVKDFAVVDGKRQACCVGDGVVPWSDILPRLIASGFSDCFSFEYEKMWYPGQLPEPEVGLCRCTDFVLNCFG